MIIARYITKEIAWAFLGATLLLLLIALSNRFAVYLAKAATGELPLDFVVRLVWLYLPELLTFLIPLSFFIAILFAEGRLHADSEIVVLSACGIGWWPRVRVILMLAGVIMSTVAFLSLWLQPKMVELREKVISEGEGIAVLQSMVPGRFQTFNEGQLVVYLEDVDTQTKTLKGVFIAEQPGFAPKHDRGLAIITSKAASVKKQRATDANEKDFYLVLNQGQRYQGNPGRADYSITRFEEYGRLVEKPREVAVNETGRLKSSAQLMHSETPEDWAELAFRLSLPLSVPILALIAIPLARVNPRHGRFAQFLPAILIYILYFNLFTLAKRYAVSHGAQALSLIFLVHVLFLGLGLALLLREGGYWLRWQRK